MEKRIFTKYSNLLEFNNVDNVEKALSSVPVVSSESRMVNVCGHFVGAPLSRGNVKVKKNTGIFSLFAGATCLNCAECIKSCYACREQRFDSVYEKRVAYTLTCAPKVGL